MISQPSVCSCILGLYSIVAFSLDSVGAAELTGAIRDAQSGRLLPARIYLQADDGQWFYVRSASADGSAVEYNRQRITPASNEYHTTISAHPFKADLPPGRYTLTVERGKEYVPVTRQVEVGDAPAEMTIDLRRWIDMSALGWYSGDTHVHRSLEDLPNIMLAEDLNVALPLTYWVTRAGVAPAAGDKNTPAGDAARLIEVDRTHVIWPINTEYEIGTVNEQRRPLGAVFVLNHRQPLAIAAPPIAPVAAEARRQGALLDLDKHNWPWSTMLIPVVGVDLFEVTNNHIWRTEFGFRTWSFGPPPAYMNVESDEQGFTERGWIDYGLKTWYALLNCGFRMRPSAGTASGVHPVPLGFGRVYVHLPEGFSYPAWIEGLDAGRSFATTGPMLTVSITGEGDQVSIDGVAHSDPPLDRIQIIVNGDVALTIHPDNLPTSRGGHESSVRSRLRIDGTSWVAVRCYEARPDGRTRFAHTAPVWFDVPARPLRPRRHEVQPFIDQLDAQIERHRDVLTPQAVAEYQAAKTQFERLLRTAR